MGNKITPNEIENVDSNSGVPILNDNFEQLADELDKVHYRDGSQAATGDWDMDSNRILNLPAPSTSLEPVRLVDLEGVADPAFTAQLNAKVNLTDVITYPVVSGEEAGTGLGQVSTSTLKYPYGDIRRYGGLGQGVSSVTQDTAALAAAVTWAWANGKGSKIYAPDTGSFYAYNGPGELAPDYLEFAGDGATRWRNVDPDQGTWYKGVIIYTGTYGPDDTQSIWAESKYNIGDVTVGSTSIICDTSADAGNWAAKDLIIILDGGSYLTSGAANTRSNRGEINEVVSVNTSTGEIILKRKTLNAYTTSTGSPQVVKVNSGMIVPGSGNREARISRGLYFHGIKFEVATTDEVNGGALVAPTLHSPLQLGATYESRFENIIIENDNGMSGNMWAYCDVSARIISAIKPLDPGYLSCGNTFNLFWIEAPNPKGSAVASLLYCHEGSCGNTINLTAYGPTWSGSNIINASSSGHNNKITIDAYLPSHSSDGAAIDCTDQDANNYITGLKVSGTILVKDIGRWIRGLGDTGAAAVVRNIDFSNMRFSGGQNTSSGTFDMVDLKNWSNANLKGMVVPIGAISLNGVQNSDASMRAPTSALTTSGTTTGLVYENGVFASVPSGFAGDTVTALGGIQLGKGRVFNKAGSAVCNAGVATELIAATSLTNFTSRRGLLIAGSVDGTTSAAAIVFFDAANAVTFLPLASMSGAFSTDGTNIKYTNSTGSNKTVAASFLRLI